MWTIDKICSLTNKPSVLNALHACRLGHPMNSPTQWRNAYCICAQQPSYVIPSDAIVWLAEQVRHEDVATEFRRIANREDATEALKE